MKFLSPLALAWLGLCVPIVALYILKVRRRRQVVPTLMFWEQVFGQARPRSIWQTLRHWVSLMLQLAMATLLALALADPVASGASQSPKHYVVVVDQSASMQAMDGQPTRFAQAKTMAGSLVRSMREQDEVTLLGAGLQTTIVCGRTHHQPTLHRAIDGLKVTDGAGDLAESLQRARAIDSGNAQREIVLITDGQGLVQVGANAAKDVKVYRCGTGEDNIGITGLSLRPRADNPVELQGMVRLTNFAGKEANVQVKLMVDGGLVDILLVKLSPGEEKAQPFRLMHTGGHELRAELEQRDALTLDNTAATNLPAIDKKHVVLVSEGNLFLQSVLESHPWMEVSRISAEMFEANQPAADIWVFDQHVPATLPDQPSLFVNPQKDSLLWTVGEELNNPLVSESDEGAALLRHVHLKNCTIHRARAIATKQQAKMLVRSFEHPLLLQWQGAESATRVVLAVDINQSDLPWRTAFPILVQNVLNDMAGRSDEPAVAKVASGESNLRLGMDLAGVESPPTGVLASVGSLPWWVILVVVAAMLSVAEWGLHQRRRID